MEIASELIEHYTNAIFSMLDERLVIRHPCSISPLTSHAYNRVLFESWKYIGFNPNEGAPSVAEIRGKVAISLGLYQKAVQGVISWGVEPGEVENLSPVLVLESLLHQQEKYIVISLSQAHVYGLLALFELYNFRVYCEALLEGAPRELGVDDLRLIAYSQDRLLVAQEAINKAESLIINSKTATDLHVPGEHDALLKLKIVELSERSKINAAIAANARHSKPGGSRDLKQQIREIWASGKYSSRDICAEEEWRSLGYGSLKAARNALTNTPDPVRIE